MTKDNNKTTQEHSVVNEPSPTEAKAEPTSQSTEPKPATDINESNPEPEQDTQSKEQKATYRVKAKPTHTAPVKKVKQGPSWFAIFAFIFSLSAIAAVAFLWWQAQLWLKNEQQVENLKQQSFNQTQQTLTDLQNKLVQLQQEQKQQQSRFVESQHNLTSIQTRVQELGQSQPNHWLSAEALYLINLAERRLLVEQDINTAQQLLVSANARLTAMQDPSVFHIQQAISEDIAKLYAIKQPDSDGLYLAISGLLGQVEQLPFAHAYIPKPVAAESQTQISNNLDDWQTNLQTSVKRFFGHFISVTRRERPVEPELPADQQWFVKANLTTQLLMIQTAILDKNNERYVDGIEQTAIWLKQYFDQTAVAVTAFESTLQELKTRDVELQLPQGLSSQALLKNYVQAQLDLKQGAEG